MLQFMGNSVPEYSFVQLVTKQDGGLSRARWCSWTGERSSTLSYGLTTLEKQVVVAAVNRFLEREGHAISDSV